jgi:thymidine phosphorylase
MEKFDSLYDFQSLYIQTQALKRKSATTLKMPAILSIYALREKLNGHDDLVETIGKMAQEMETRKYWVEISASPHPHRTWRTVGRAFKQIVRLVEHSGGEETPMEVGKDYEFFTHIHTQYMIKAKDGRVLKYLPAHAGMPLLHKRARDDEMRQILEQNAGARVYKVGAPYIDDDERGLQWTRGKSFECIVK